MKLAAIAATAVAFLPPCAAHATACDILKNGTYAGIMQGPFESYPDAFSAMNLTFDASAVGHGRGVIGFDPNNPTAAQGLYAKVICAPDPDGVSGVLVFGAGMGTSSFKVYDGGARIWARHDVPGRNISGWLFRLPTPQTAAPQAANPTPR